MTHEIYADYMDLQEPYGIDESWLDVSTCYTQLGNSWNGFGGGRLY